MKKIITWKCHKCKETFVSKNEEEFNEDLKKHQKVCDINFVIIINDS